MEEGSIGPIPAKYSNRTTGISKTHRCRPAAVRLSSVTSWCRRASSSVMTPVGANHLQWAPWSNSAGGCNRSCILDKRMDYKSSHPIYGEFGRK